MSSPSSATCYLCGEEIQDRASQDHVPPKHFFPKRIREQANPDLLTLPAHPDCNSGYARDEEYFYQSLSPLAWNTALGPVLKEDLVRRYRREEGIRLGRMVLAEFDKKVGQIWLPEGYVAKRVDGARAGRVIWKIVRGLFFNERQRFLPEDTPHTIRIHAEDNLPEEYEAFAALESRGRYPTIFDYRYWCDESANDGEAGCIWGVLFWRKVFGLTAFPLPEHQ